MDFRKIVFVILFTLPSTGLTATLISRDQFMNRFSRTWACLDDHNEALNQAILDTVGSMANPKYQKQKFVIVSNLLSLKDLNTSIEPEILKYIHSSTNDKTWNNPAQNSNLSLLENYAYQNLVIQLDNFTKNYVGVQNALASYDVKIRNVSTCKEEARLILRAP